ncbi:MAG: protein-disulfide reductase DsbD family protein [Reinekea sp.]
MKKVWLALMLLVALPVFADDFLPVEEAFQVDVQRVGSELLMDFDITDGYYLYRDRYKANVKEGAMLSDALFSDNVELKYDPNFDEDMAVFHHTMQVRHQVLNEAGMVQVVYQGCAEAGRLDCDQRNIVCHRWWFDPEPDAMRIPGIVPQSYAVGPIRPGS